MSIFNGLAYFTTSLGFMLVSGSIFTTDVDRNNDLVVIEEFFSEESLVVIIVKQCLPVFSYGAGVRRIK